MTIYIAICDDNVADRKQIERLLNREKDARLNTKGDVLYIDSFGSSDALNKTPIKYDLFLVDVTDSTPHGMDIAKSLRARGILAPIVLLTSKIDYKSFSNEPDRIIHLEKPVNSGQIAHLIDIADDWNSRKPKLIEIHGKKDTVFLPHEELVSATQKNNYVKVSVSDGSFIEIPCSLKHFQKDLNGYSCFIPCKNAVVSLHHVVGFSGNEITLSNDETFTLSTFRPKRLLNNFIRYTIEKNTGKDK